jgi:uncharacterized membrane protein HdeD (DUF308 family)
VTVWLGALWLCIGVVACVLAFASNRKARPVPFTRASFASLGVLSLVIGTRDLRLLSEAITGPLTWIALAACLLCLIGAWGAGEIPRPPAGDNRP